MKLALSIQPSAMDTALLGAVRASEALPYPSPVPLAPFALDNSRDYRLQRGYSRATTSAPHLVVARRPGLKLCSLGNGLDEGVTMAHRSPSSACRRLRSRRFG